MRAVLSAVLAASAVPGSALADDEPWLDAAELRAAFAGQTIAGAYPDRVTFTERYDTDGRLVYKTDADEPWRGQWHAEGQYFCTIYDASGSGGCFKVRRDGANCFRFHFATREPAEVAQGPEADAAWTAIAWRADAPSTCPEQPVV